ncbi:MAG: carboxypeptidase regulatory-like domain-containing protein [Acidobacteria bacterium]|nr:carboxypeptidase regulatory-like domain-containing protein [Acidobacteriota bacterium]
MKKLLLLLIFVISFSSISFAASFVVNNNGDTNDASTSDNLCLDASGNCTLRAAIQQANASAGDDTITFALAFPSTIRLTLGELQITSNITITGAGARNLIISGNNTSRVFSIVGVGVVVNLSALTVADGNAGNIVYGGGIRTLNGPTLNLIQVTVRNNFAGGGGGGIDHSIGRLNILNSTISNNSDNTAQIGGGIINFAPMTLNNVTISNNTATVRGGGLRDNVIADVRNTIIANNTAPSGSDVDGAFTSLGNNLIGNSTDSTGFTNGVNGDIVGTAAAPINPLLGPLQDNGGQTDTRALLPGSPAVDAGNNCLVTATCSSNNPFLPLMTDQRGLGFFRLIDGNSDGVAIVDIGAFETLAPTAASVTVGGRVMTTSDRGIRNVVVTMTDSQGNTRTTKTTSFGYYRFTDVAAGETYIFTARAKRFAFANNTQVHSIMEDINNINFVVNDEIFTP